MKRVPLKPVAGVLALLLIIGAVLVRVWLPAFLEPRLEKRLEKQLGAQVAIKGLSFGLISGSRIDRLVVTPRRNGDQSRAVIQLSDLSIDHAPGDLLKGRYRVTRVRIGSVQAGVDSEMIDWARRLRAPPQPSPAFPRLEIEQGRIRFDLPRLRQELPVNDLRLSAGPADAGRISGRLHFASGDYTVRLGFEVYPGSGYVEADIKGVINMADGIIEVPRAGLTYTQQKTDRFRLRADVRVLNLERFNETIISRNFSFARQPDIKSGSLRGEIQVQWCAENGLEYGGDFTVRDVSLAASEKYPEIKELNAELSLDAPGRVFVRQSSARLLGGRVTADGSFFLADGEITRPRLRFQFTGIPQTRTLAELLPQNVEKGISLTGVKDAETDGTITLAPESVDVDLTVRAPAASPPDLPFHLDDVAVRIKWTSGTGRVFFKDFSGRMAGSPVEGDGVLKFHDEIRTDFYIRGRHLPLNNDLLNWLAGDMDRWRAEGGYDIELWADNWQPKDTPAASLAGLKARIALHGVRLSRPDIGTAVEYGHGYAVLEEGEVRLAGLRGELFGVGLRGRGIIPVEDAGTGPRLHVESENIVLRPDFFRRLPFDTAETDWFQDLNMIARGRVQAEIQVPVNKENPFQGSVSAIIHHLEMSPGDTRITTDGTIGFDILGTGFADLRMAGTINANRLGVGDFTGDRLSGDFVYQPGRLDVSEMTLAAYGGRITAGTTTVNLSDHTWQTEFTVSHMNFESLMGMFYAGDWEIPSGVLRSKMEIGGRGRDPEALSGGGTIRIDRGRLYSFPILVSALRVLDLQLPTRSPITDARGAIILEAGRLQVRDLFFTGGTLPIHLEGHVELKAGVPLKHQQINLLATVAKGEGWLDRVPLVNWVKHYTIDQLRQMVFQSRVTGTLVDYQTRTLTRPVMMPIQKLLAWMEKIIPSPPDPEQE